MNGFNLRPWNSLYVFDNLEMMVQKLSATDVLSSVGRLLVYPFVQQGVQFLFFPIFSYLLSLFLFSPIFKLKPPIFPIFLVGRPNFVTNFKMKA